MRPADADALATLLQAAAIAFVLGWCWRKLTGGRKGRARRKRWFRRRSRPGSRPRTPAPETKAKRPSLAAVTLAGMRESGQQKAKDDADARKKLAIIRKQQQKHQVEKRRGLP